MEVWEDGFQPTIGKLQSQSMAVSMNHHELTETAIATVGLPERIESVKAGLLGALTAGLLFGALVLVNDWLSLRFAQLAALPISTDSLMVLVSGAIALLSGFLFGVTYRYIIRQDQNPHLRSGAVLAFGLVRGLALAEGRLYEPIALLSLVVLGIESLLLFAGVRVVLDGALAAGWVKPFGSLTATLAKPSDERLTSNAYGAKSSNSG